MAIAPGGPHTSGGPAGGIEPHTPLFLSGGLV
jgi:hypothetical protein